MHTVLRRRHVQYGSRRRWPPPLTSFCAPMS